MRPALTLTLFIDDWQSTMDFSHLLKILNSAVIQKFLQLYLHVLLNYGNKAAYVKISFEAPGTRPNRHPLKPVHQIVSIRCLCTCCFYGKRDKCSLDNMLSTCHFELHPDTWLAQFLSLYDDW